MTSTINFKFIRKAAGMSLTELELKKRPDGGFRKHPSDFFKRNYLILAGDLSHKEVAERLSITPAHLSSFLSGKLIIEPFLAVRLAKATGIDMGTWLELQRQYNAFIYSNIECDAQPLYPLSQ